MYEQLRQTVSLLGQLCFEIEYAIDSQILNGKLIESYIDELEIGDYSIMSALHNALTESMINNT